MRLRLIFFALILASVWAWSAAHVTSRSGVSLPQPVAYSSGTSYARGDVVTSGGSTYVSLQTNNSGNTPASSPSAWQALGSSGGGTTTHALTGSASGGAAPGTANA